MSRFGVVASLAVLAVALAAGCRAPMGATAPTAILKQGALVGPDGASLIGAQSAETTDRPALPGASAAASAAPCPPSASPSAAPTPAPTATPNERKTMQAVTPAPAASPSASPRPCE